MVPCYRRGAHRRRQQAVTRGANQGCRHPGTAGVGRRRTHGPIQQTRMAAARLAAHHHHARVEFGAKRTRPVASSTAPGKHPPRPDNCSCRWVRSCHACQTILAACWHAGRGCLPASGWCVVARTSPVSDTPATRIRCTPISTPVNTRVLPSMRSGVDGPSQTVRGYWRVGLAEPVLVQQLAHQRTDG